MKVAFVVFDGMTALDFVGIYDCITRLKSMGFMPALSWEICALSDQVSDDHGLQVASTWTSRPLESFDMLVVPGGLGTRRLQHDGDFTEWLKSGESASLKVSVCTGALLMGAAGFLTGRRATTHPSAYGELEPYCREVVSERVVEDGDIITARGVSSSIDAGLYVVSRLEGEAVRRKIARQMDYPYDWKALEPETSSQ
ncbi:MAG: DJ-1/PfpI family protein [Gammaproteobacteria bacterium]|nr:MAG: DJ-1/PfpI family protein [Gammaproteobacteria bacterium]